MSSKTFIPAFQAKVGTWTYYTCLMKYAQVAREVQFAHEIGGNRDLGTMIQRSIGERTKAITEYLLTNENRFLGSLIIAVWGGEPGFTPLEMSADAENQEMLQGIDRDFGVLTFDGTQRYFALDGQHRLKAIKDAVMRDERLVTEDISVIVVPHFDTEEGRRRTRRLFTNINRNVKTTTAAENLALDEDDGFAILTRRLLDEHAFLGMDGVVRIFVRQGQEGDLKLASGKNVPKRSPAWTNISVLYELLQHLGFNLDVRMYHQSQRASDEILDQSYDLLAARIDDLLQACGDLIGQYNNHPTPKEMRAPKGREGEGHAFMRPVVQIQVVKAIRQIIESGILDWAQVMKRLRGLDWRISRPPFSAVWMTDPESPGKGRMVSGKENAELLHDLLLIHLAPTSKAQITRAMRDYRAILRENYSVSAEELAALIAPDPPK